jgi:hypothetical protein
LENAVFQLGAWQFAPSREDLPSKEHGPEEHGPEEHRSEEHGPEEYGPEERSRVGVGLGMNDGESAF